MFVDPGSFAFVDARTPGPLSRCTFTAGALTTDSAIVGFSPGFCLHKSEGFGLVTMIQQLSSKF